LVKNGARTVRDLILATERRLAAAGLYYGHGTDNPRDEAAWLVGAALGIEPQALDVHLGDVPAAAGTAKVETLVAERIRTRQPLAYLINEAWFAGHRLYVDERVIVPRSLVGEFILERFVPWVEPARVWRALDLCTGSGCIAIALAHAFPQARVDAADISAPALAVARRNVDAHRLAGRVRLIESDLFAALAGEVYDLIVTNPPYVAPHELPGLPAEYRHEPELALVSGRDGLAAITRILAAAADHLAAHGALVAEVGNSNHALAAAFPEVPFLWLTTASGDDSVFLLTAAELRRHTPAFRLRRVRG
jgi:ribosomal protein L3 glutamine methyltransferase